MILAMRRQAPVILAVALVGVSLVAAAQVVISNVPAPKAVTFDEVRVFVYTTLAMVLLTVCGSAAGLVAFVLNRDRAAAAAGVAAAAAALAADQGVRKEQFAVIGDAVKAVGKSVQSLTDVMTEHKRDPFAHPAVAHATYKETEERMDKMAADLSTLLAEHYLLHGRALVKRSEDGPDVDIEKLRGKP